MKAPGFNLDAHEDHVYDMMRYMFSGGPWFTGEKRPPEFEEVEESNIGLRLVRRISDGVLFMNVDDNDGGHDRVGPLTDEQVAAFQVLKQIGE